MLNKSSVPQSPERTEDFLAFASRLLQPGAVLTLVDEDVIALKTQAKKRRMGRRAEVAQPGQSWQAVMELIQGARLPVNTQLWQEKFSSLEQCSCLAGQMRIHPQLVQWLMTYVLRFQTGQVLYRYGEPISLEMNLRPIWGLLAMFWLQQRLYAAAGQPNHQAPGGLDQLEKLAWEQATGAGEPPATLAEQIVLAGLVRAAADTFAQAGHSAQARQQQLLVEFCSARATAAGPLAWPWLMRAMPTRSLNFAPVQLSQFLSYAPLGTANYLAMLLADTLPLRSALDSCASLGAVFSTLYPLAFGEGQDPDPDYKILSFLLLFYTHLVQTYPDQDELDRLVAGRESSLGALFNGVVRVVDNAERLNKRLRLSEQAGQFMALYRTLMCRDETDQLAQRRVIERLQRAHASLINARAPLQVTKEEVTV